MGINGKDQWCEKHWEPFRQMGGQSGIAAAMGLMQLVINDPEFNSKVPDITKSVEANKIMSDMCPLCCRYPDFLDEMHKVRREQNRQMTMDDIQSFIKQKFGKQQ